MTIFNRSIATILVFICLSCTEAFANTYLIGQGDVLSVRIYNEEGLDGDYSVSETGTIKLPLIGEVSVAGLAPIDASEMLESRFKKMNIAPHQMSTLKSKSMHLSRSKS